MMDARFSSAIHTLIMIAGAEVPMSSEKIAKSVGTNASYIRKITRLLKARGIIKSRQGVRGFAMAVPPEDLTLYQVYQAVAESEQVHVFDLHQNPSDRCVVGRHIRPVLTDVFHEAESALERQLRGTTLADCMDKMRIEMQKEEQA